MIEITRDWIAMMAPNISAVKNGKSLAETGAFLACGKDKEETVLFASCKGSGKNIYSCFVDFSGESPKFQCSCPSRQIPCKHCVGLLTLQLINPMAFSEQELPESIVTYRQKRDIREEKKEKQKSVSKTKNTTLTTTAKKKLEKQLEGLALAEKFVWETMEKGVASLLSGNVSAYEALAKEMGNYYLNGVQSVLWELLDMVRQGISGEEKSTELVCTMVKLQQQINQCRAYLQNQIDENRAMPSLEKSYELLGNLWKMEQLKQLGAVKEKVELVQLSFEVIEDKVQKRFEDIGYYMVLDTKEIVKTVNLVPFKAAKHINRDDSIMDMIEAESLVYYPGDKNCRVRMENIQMKPGEEHHWKSVLEGAVSIGEALKIVKNQFKNPLAEEQCVLAVSVKEVMEKENVLMFADEKEAFVVGCKEGQKDNSSYFREYSHITYRDFSYELSHGVFIVKFWYNQKQNQICGMPLSLVTESGIIRFL